MKISLSIVVMLFLWVSPLSGLAFYMSDSKTAESKQAMGKAALSEMRELAEANREIEKENKAREQEIFAARERRRRELMQTYNPIEKTGVTTSIAKVPSPVAQIIYISLPIIIVGAVAFLIVRKTSAVEDKTSPKSVRYAARQMLAEKMLNSSNSQSGLNMKRKL